MNGTKENENELKKTQDLIKGNLGFGAIDIVLGAAATGIAVWAISLLINSTKWGDFALIVACLGIAAFAIPVVLSFSKRFNLANRFGNGEVRKAIVISLTVVYILLLSIYFIDVTLPMSKALINLTNQTNGLPFKLIGNHSSGISNSTSFVLSNSNVTVFNSVPSEALKDITTNFLWVYIVIIGFYFGSRTWESITETNMLKDLKEMTPRDLAKRRFILGSLSPENFKEIREELKEEFNDETRGVTILDIEKKDDGSMILILKNSDGKPKTINVRVCGYSSEEKGKFTRNFTEKIAPDFKIENAEYVTIHAEKDKLKGKPEETKIVKLVFEVSEGDNSSTKAIHL